MTGHRGARLQRRVICPECGSRETVNMDGTLRRHPIRAVTSCPGSSIQVGAAHALVMSWDWKAQPNLRKLALMVHEISGGTVFMREIETGGDFYMLVVGDHEVTDDEALELRLS